MLKGFLHLWQELLLEPVRLATTILIYSDGYEVHTVNRTRPVRHGVASNCWISHSKCLWFLIRGTHMYPLMPQPQAQLGRVADRRPMVEPGTRGPITVSDACSPARSWAVHPPCHQQRRHGAGVMVGPNQPTPTYQASYLPDLPTNH